MIDQESELKKKIHEYEDNLLTAKVELEQLKLQESDESKHLQQLDKIRCSVNKEFEISEQREIVSSFELQEVKLAHDELASTISKMKKECLISIETQLNAIVEEVILHFLE
jgi:hypothetical protein